MKKIFFILLFTNCSLLIVNAQWQPDFRLTNAPLPSYTSNNNTWCVAASGNVVHVAWDDYRDGGNNEIYYKRSTDGGSTWGTDIRLTNDPAESSIPSVAVSGQNVYIIWKDYRQSAPEIYLKRSTDGGVTWSVDTPLTISPGYIDYPCITVSGQNVHVVWRDQRDANYEIYYKRSTDGGANWGADTRLTNDPATSADPSVCVSGSTVHIVWRDQRDGNNEIYYKRSTDGGSTWGADTRLTNDPAISAVPSISASGIAVHIVWRDNRDGNENIYYKRSTNGGVSWGADTRLSTGASVSEWPSVAVSGSSVHVVWFDLRDGNAEIYYKRDPTGNPNGIININSEIPKQFSLSQNYPNPFNPSSKVKFQMSKLAFAKLVIFDVLGREVATLVNEELKPGTYEVEFDGSNFSSGIYYYKLSASTPLSTTYTETRKMVLMK